MNILKIYNETQWSLVSLNEQIYRVGKNRHGITADFLKTPTDSAEVERISLSRTKRRIKEILLCNNFEYFATLTVSSKIPEYNRFDLEDCVDNIKKLMKKIKRNYSDFKYLYIIEEHKKGGYHFHGMIKGLPADVFYINKNGFLSCKLFDVLGFNSFDKIRDYNKCCNYITKYITKNCCRTENGQIYFCSRGLKKPSEELMIPCDLKNIFGECFENEYCQKKDFDVTRLSNKQKMLLNNYFAYNDEILQKDENIIKNWLQLFTNKNLNGKISIRS